ncbi:hypothetical protein B7L51_019425 [Pectobacterium brasiliense]|uniref:hypothetical protein n=1 Tax=Pectobacterium brasiliense TaxID=180957 RepID=UPI000B969275|nr:hypothetical protein [Pectobacterium carotovorum]OYN49451.1 hypothetical protein B7L51_19470 [Pectobacterium carotovorum]
MTRIIDFWNVKITLLGGELISATTKREPKIEDGFIHLHLHEDGEDHQIGYSLATIYRYSISTEMKR